MLKHRPTRSSLVFYLNGKRMELFDVQPQMTVLTYLRSIGLTGSKLGCGEGGCGACTILVSRISTDQSSSNNDLSSFEDQKVLHTSVNACLLPIASIDFCHLTTIEGLGSTSTGLHPLQSKMSTCHGSQCGFCTPGIIMALYALFLNDPEMKIQDMEKKFDGNLCRCTGYRPILDAAKGFCTTEDVCTTCPVKGSCTNHTEIGDMEDMVHSCSHMKRMENNDDKPTTWTSFEFPKELYGKNKDYLKMEGKEVAWYRPSTLMQLLDLKNEYGDNARLVCDIH